MSLKFKILIIYPVAYCTNTIQMLDFLSRKSVNKYSAASSREPSQQVTEAPPTQRLQAVCQKKTRKLGADRRAPLVAVIWGGYKVTSHCGRHHGDRHTGRVPFVWPVTVTTARAQFSETTRGSRKCFFLLLLSPETLPTAAKRASLALAKVSNLSAVTFTHFPEVSVKFALTSTCRCAGSRVDAQ